MLLTIFKNLYTMIFMHIFSADSNNSNIKKDYLQHSKYKDNHILDQVSDINQPLTSIFPFLSLNRRVCIEHSKRLYNGIDNLNLGELNNIKRFKLNYSSIREVPLYIKSFRSIYHLSFLSNALTSSCFDIISQLVTLKSLDLRYNSIKDIPESISKLVNLEQFEFDGNSFTHITSFLYNLNLKKLSLKNLKSVYTKTDVILNVINDSLKIMTLESLMVDFNNISGLELDNREYYLKKLSISYCELFELPNSILKLKNLEYLNLEGNKFITVPEGLVELENLRELNLKANEIISHKNIFFHSLEILSIQFNRDSEEIISIKNKIYYHLKHLIIYICSTGCNDISFEMETMKDLKSLSIDSFSEIKIPKNIYILKNLQSLTLDGGLNVNAIYPILSLENLKTLRLSFKADEPIKFTQTLFSVLVNIKTLEYLSLTEYDINNKIDDRLFDIENLKELSLNEFFVDNIKKFSKLRNLKSIKFKSVKFSELEKHVKFFLKQKRIKSEYKNCNFNCNPVNTGKNKNLL